MPNTVTINTKATGVGKVESEVDRLKGKFAQLSTSAGFKSVVKGAAMGAGIGAFNALANAAAMAVSGIVDFAGSSVQAASDTAEALSKVRVVFGDSAKSVEDFAATAADKLGMSKLAALDATGAFGNLFTAMGMAQPEAAAMSTKITTLASDLASFNNIDMASALEKLRSGLVGEAEPMRTLGVNLNEAAVAAKAVELGLAKTKGAVSDSAKIQARYALILDQTKSAQGDYARTSDGLANTQRHLQAEIDDLSASIGAELQPVFLDFTRWVASDGVQIIKDLVGTFKDLADAVGDTFDAFHLPGPEEVKDRLYDVDEAVVIVGSDWDTLTHKVSGSRGTWDGGAAALQSVGGAAADAAERLKILNGIFKTNANRVGGATDELWKYYDVLMRLFGGSGKPTPPNLRFEPGFGGPGKKGSGGKDPSGTGIQTVSSSTLPPAGSGTGSTTINLVVDGAVLASVVDRRLGATSRSSSTL